RGFPPPPGARAYLRRLATLFEASDDSVLRADDILGLRSDALLLRCTNSGTDRASGGAFERHFLMLRAFGTDGLATRHELFEVGRDDEALARFDELVPSEACPEPGRTDEGLT